MFKCTDMEHRKNAQEGRRRFPPDLSQCAWQCKRRCPHRVICGLPGLVVYGGRLSRFCPSVSHIAIAMEGERWNFSPILSISRYAPGRTRGFCDLVMIFQRECWNYAVWEKSRLGDYALKAPSAIISHQNVGLYPQSDRFALISHNSIDTHPSHRQPTPLRAYIDAAVGSESNSARSLAISFCTLSKCCAVL